MRKLVIVAAAGVLAVGATAFARTEVSARSTLVSAKGLDRSDPADMAVLYARIQEAANRVCTRSADDFGLAAASDREACVQNAVAGAVARTGSRELSAQHATALRNASATRG